MRGCASQAHPLHETILRVVSIDIVRAIELASTKNYSISCSNNSSSISSSRSISSSGGKDMVVPEYILTHPRAL